MVAIQNKPVAGRCMSMDERDDLALLTAIARQRDSEAFTQLVERHREQAFNLSYRMLRNSALAEDAVQESMLSIWTSAGSMTHGNAKAWIMRIVINKSRHLSRSRKLSARREERIGMERETSGTSGTEQAESDELVAKLREHIDRLPELEAQLLVCSYGANMTHREIGEVFKLPRQTVTDKIQQALNLLRGSLTSAGVAAVAPLGAESLLAALSGGHACPTDLTAKILGKVSTRGPGSFPRSKRMQKVPGGTSVTAGVVAAVAITGAGVWWAMSPNSSAPAKPVEHKATPPETKPAADERIYRRWTFETGPAQDLVAVKGSWKWKRNNEREPGFMDVIEKTDILLPESIPAKPMLVTIKYRSLQKGDFAVGADWSAEKNLVPAKLWDYGWVGAPFGERLNYTYFLGGYVASLHEMKSVPFEKLVFKPAHPGVLAPLKPQAMAFFKEYSQAPDKIRVFLKNIEVTEIVLQSVRPDEIPGLLQNPGELKTHLGEPNAK
jgi:RNA polymerase sigma-70 factor (ECF subfamily)